MIRRFRPSPAMVVASIALFVAVGGISWAAATIGTNDIQNKAVTAKKLHNHAVGKRKIKRHAVAGEKLRGDQRTVWAAVKLSGAISDQSGGIKAEQTGTGHYVVDFGKNVSGRALVVSATRQREIAGAYLCNGGPGPGKDCSPNDRNDSRHVRVVTTLPGNLGQARFTNFPFYIAALPK
jgi:hypothetical protein